MALPFFFESVLPIQAQKHFTLSEDTSKHCIQVLRMKAGEQLQLTDGKGTLVTATIYKEDKRNTQVAINSLVSINSLELQQTPKVSIAISLVKNPTRFEWFLEKATELGVHEIIPLLCQRTEKTQFRVERYKGILIAAMLQSQQTFLPLLHPPTSYSTVIATSKYPQKLIAHCEDSVKNTIHQIDKTHLNFQILIGPEGDFTPEEIHQALTQGYQPVSLGHTRLRTETAGIVAATLLVN